jgi:hypothetical protein
MPVDLNTVIAWNRNLASCLNTHHIVRSLRAEDHALLWFVHRKGTDEEEQQGRPRKM